MTRLFLDENLDSDVVATTLREAKVPFERFGDHFARGTEDERWIPAVAARPWTIVTRDARIRRNPAEKEAWRAASAILVIVRGTALRAIDIAEALVGGFPRIEKLIRTHRSPMVIYVHPDGTVEMKESGGRRGGPR